MKCDKIYKRMRQLLICICTVAMGVLPVLALNINSETVETASYWLLGNSGISAWSGDSAACITAQGIDYITLGTDNSSVNSGGISSTDGSTAGISWANVKTPYLAYTDGQVEIAHDTVLVGLRYYYSKSRNTALSEPHLQNSVGSGYEIGYYNDAREFVPLAETTSEKLTMRITGSARIGVYDSDSGILIYESHDTGLSNMLAIHPLADGEDAVTWFSGYMYYGDFIYAVLGGEKITVINAVNIEQYVQCVCSNEMSNTWPLEALKAQAVAARSYAAYNMEHSLYSASCGFDLTGDTYSQSYTGCGNVNELIREASESTAGQYLTYQGNICDALYFSSDGGATEDNENVNGNSYHGYLKGIIDPYEAAASDINKYSEWEYTLTRAQIASRVGLTSVAGIEVTYSDVGNVIALRITADNGNTVTVRNAACRTVMGMPSIHYEVYVCDEGYRFVGSGWGHNLGMSQYGAYAMAEYYGMNYLDILGFYYTDAGLSNGRYTG